MAKFIVDQFHKKTSVLLEPLFSKLWDDHPFEFIVFLVYTYIAVWWISDCTEFSSSVGGVGKVSQSLPLWH